MKFIHTKYLLLAGCILLAYFLSPAFSFAGDMSSAGYTVRTEVLSNGGGVLLSTSYTTASTIGQPSPIGVSRSTSYINQAGFWFQSTANSILKKRSILWLALPAILSGAGE